MHEKQTIVLFQGQSQYNVLNGFMDELSKAFSKLGYHTEMIWLTHPDFPNQLANVLRTQKISFFFSFNAMAIDLRMNNQPLYDQVHIPLFAFLVDHPMYHLQRLNSGVQNLIVSCVDYDHLLFLKNYLNGHYTKAYIPHGTACERPSVDSVDERPIDVLFSGTFHDPKAFRAQLASYPEPVVTFCEKVIERARYELYQPLDQLALAVLEEEGMDDGYMVQSTIYQLLMQIDQYVRSWRRKKVIEELVHTGLKVEVYGNGWGPLSKTIHSISFHPAINYPEILEKMRKSKVVLTVMPNFTSGGHERVFDAMRQGAISVVNDNQFFRDQFSPKELMTYSFQENVGLKIKRALSSNDALMSMVKSGQDKVVTRHSWLQRAQRIVDVAASHKFFMM
ncbi:MAG: glycosyltransferase [Sporolactobacillus sp.]